MEFKKTIVFDVVLAFEFAMEFGCIWEFEVAPEIQNVLNFNVKSEMKRLLKKMDSFRVGGRGKKRTEEKNGKSRTREEKHGSQF